MKVFHCDQCQHLVFFESIECVNCHSVLAYAPDLGAMTAIVPLAEVPFAALEADDARVFPAPRAAFLRAWIGMRRHIGRDMP